VWLRSVLICCVAAINVAAEEPVQLSQQQVTVAVNAPGSFPYLYFDTATQRYAGIVVDFLDTVSEIEHLSVNYIDSNQLRSEQFLHDGKADLYMVNPAWLKQPDAVITTEPMFSHDTYLYSTQPFSRYFSLEQQQGARICTHENFVYTGLSQGFAKQQIQRVDASTNASMAAMLATKRCDYAVFNNYNAIDAFYTPQHCQLSVYQSPEPTSVVDLVLVMRPALQSLRTLLNKHITNYRGSGALQRAIDSHVPDKRFPKRPNCS